jgi:ABC-type Fe3+/spermidine/putrescine transport system ATPase subunit
LTTWLACRDIAKRLGARSVLRHLDLTVSRGEIVSILGPSGAGKTTLIRLIAGLGDPDKGEIEIAGRRVWGDRVNLKTEHRGVGFVFQDYAIWPHMSIADNVAFGLRMSGMNRTDREARVREALTAVHILELAERFPDQLSGGQQQRVALARTLAVRPELILLDEPLSNLDAGLRENLRLEILEIVRAHGTTAIYITHDQSEAMALCDRLAVINDGRILQIGPPEELYHRPNCAFVASFLGGVNLLAGHVVAGADRTVFAADEVTLRVATVTARDPYRAAILIRPEDAEPAERYPFNRLTGQVASCSFLGRCWRLAVNVAGRDFRIDWDERVSAGEDFAFSIAPERCTIVPADGLSPEA